MLKVMEKGALREASRELFELDEIALAGARRMLMAALRRKPPTMWSAIVMNATPRGGRWWCITAGPRGAS